MLDDFKKSYDKTVAAINKPQIDTRSISTKDAMKADLKQTKDDVKVVGDKVKKIIKK
jgi:hypothetical protein